MEGHECCPPGDWRNWYQVHANSKNELLSEGELEEKKQSTCQMLY